MSFFSVFNFSWETRKTNVISREKTRKVREIFYLKEAPNLSKKVHKKFAKTLSQKSTIFLVKGTQFLTPKQFLLHFYALIFFRCQIMQFFCCFFLYFLPKKKVFFRPVNFSFFSPYFLVRNFSSSNSSFSHEKWHA